MFERGTLTLGIINMTIITWLLIVKDLEGTRICLGISMYLFCIICNHILSLYLCICACVIFTNLSCPDMYLAGILPYLFCVHIANSYQDHMIMYG